MFRLLRKRRQPVDSDVPIVSVPHEELADKLRDLIRVRAVSPSSIILRRNFWQRCTLVNPKWSYEAHTFIYVDGIVGACKWNCCRTYEQSSNGNLCIWLGYAFNRGTWMEHCWCMLGDKIVETEDAHDIYFGAELSADEYKLLVKRCRRSDLSERTKARLWTVDDGWRTIIPYDPAIHADGIGRERDRLTNQPKQRLGE
jgi:hypothetical protein